MAIRYIMLTLHHQILLLAACLVFCSCGKQNNSEGPFSSSTEEQFPVTVYNESPESLQGNRYQMKAQIDRQLGWRPGVGKIILVQASNAAGLVKKVVVYFPEELGATVLPGQKLLLKVHVGEMSLITVESYEKY
jgi:hypothetical protein